MDDLIEIELLDKWAEDPIDRDRRSGIAPDHTTEQEAHFRAVWRRRMEQAREDVLRRDWASALDKLDKSERLGLLSEWWNEDCLTLEELRAALPGTWSRSEPDDTDPEWLALWTDAAESGRVETDPLPDGDPLTIYRGEPEAPAAGSRGIAWSLSRDTATFFALQPPWSQGTAIVLEGSVPRRDVLGHVTDRNHAEVIVEPKHVRVTAIHAVAEADRPEREEP